MVWFLQNPPDYENTRGSCRTWSQFLSPLQMILLWWTKGVDSRTFLIIENLLNDTLHDSFDYNRLIATVSNEKSLFYRIASNIFSTILSNHCYKCQVAMFALKVPAYSSRYLQCKLCTDATEGSVCPK